MAGSIQARWLFAGDDTRPSSITIFGLTGGAERRLKILLDVLQPPVTFALQALFMRKTPVVPFVGPTTGNGLSNGIIFATRPDRQDNPGF